MTVYRPSDRPTYVYDFIFQGKRHRKNTGQIRLVDAKQVEANEKLRLRQLAAGLLSDSEPPTFSEWAEIYYDYAKSPKNPRPITRPERLADIIRVVLRFWGHPPDPESDVTRHVGEPYHSLNLVDPVRDPDWIVQFEDWMLARGIGPQTRNHYRSVMSRMYRTAMLPRFRKRTGIAMNPFLGVERDRVHRRMVTVTPDELRAWIAAASPHIRLALAIGALAPKLRVANILGLKWSEHIDERLQFITVWDHKTASTTGAPQVTPIPAQLKTILKHARRLHPDAAHVITYRGRPLRNIRNGVQQAAVRAGLRYGRDRNGVTFHTLRHMASTEMANLDIAEHKRKEAIGHRDIATTQSYTHLRPQRLVETLERWSRALPIADAVMSGGENEGEGS